MDFSDHAFYGSDPIRDREKPIKGTNEPMPWTNDKRLLETTLQLQKEYGDSALAVAVDRWLRAEDSLAQAEKQLDHLERKVCHGCTDAHCEECDQ